MKLLRYGPAGREKPGLLDADGKIRDLSGQIADVDGQALTSETLGRLAKLDPATLPIVDGSPRLGCPVGGVSKFVAVGLNYADHAAEANMPLPSEPIIFFKATSCIVGPNDDVGYFRLVFTKGDWEIELGIVIGRTARYVEEREALDYIAGYCLVNDVSEREYQLERGGAWDKGKGFDTFGPVGPVLVTADELGSPQSLEMWLDVNDQRMQTGSTKTMIFGVATLVSYISRIMTLFSRAPLGLLIEMTGMARAMVGFLAAFSAMCAAGCTTCSSAPCTWCRASPGPRRPTWRRWRPCCSPK